MEQGLVFNIQRFSTHDGPGIRTSVFLKGCNLRCKWCHNPESYDPRPQIEYFADRCTGCGRCMEVCPEGITIENGRLAGAERCRACGRCAQVCLSGARKTAGTYYDVETLVGIVKKDLAFYKNSGGGVTCSGGEPMLQYRFVKEFFKALKEQGISTALDTAGHIPYEWYEEVLPCTDLVLLDLKIMDPALHKAYTGVSNERILKNAKRMLESGTRLHIRVPVIAGVNDNEENMRKLNAFLAGYKNVEEVRLLPYHAMGLAKAASMGVDMETFERPSEERMEVLRNCVRFPCTPRI